MGILAHYLEIEWEAVGAPRRVEVSTYPIEIEAAPDGTLHAEVSIFRNFAPWVGLKLSGDLAEVEPFTVNAQDGRVAWLRVSDGHGGAWWIPATGWSKTNNRHTSEMHRSFGSFSVELGPHRNLVLDAVALELDRAHAQEYLEDFRDELVWLAVGRPTGALGEVGSDHSREIVDALRGFADAAGHVLEHPACEIREVTAPAPAARLRPNSETFRAVMRRPGSRLYPGRSAQKSADVPENRYLHHLVAHCQRLAQSFARSSDRHQNHLTARAAREETRANDLLTIERIEVDQEIFDNQLFDLRRRLDAIAVWVGTPCPPGSRQYRFTVGKEFKANRDGAKEIFYRTPDRDIRYDEHEGIDFSVARLPDDLHELVKAGHAIDKDLALSLTGKASITKFFTATGKVGRRAAFTHISKVQPHSPVLERREAMRDRYERDGWHRSVGSKEREEYRSEARAALARSAQFSERAQGGAVTSSEASAIGNALSRQAADWARLKVAPSSLFPMGTSFAQNPNYAAALAAFHKVTALERRTGLSGDTLDKLGRINILHASALYERWCLIKIIAVLVQDFDFVPQGDWLQHVVTSVSEAGRPGDTGVSINFTRTDPSMTARLDVEPVLANGRRPDFRLRFSVVPATGTPEREDAPRSRSARPIFGDPPQQRSGLVMDAKFRTRWARDELAAILTLLVDTKDYGQDGDRVFILHPARSAIARRTSPLVWGRECDYGQNHPTSHTHGSIQLAAGPVSGASSTINLRRLIALELQAVFPEPEFERENTRNSGRNESRSGGDPEICQSNASFCISCGKVHGTSDVTQGRTEGGNPKWFYRCMHCTAQTMRTHCFRCGTSLHKNGLQMTYHLTLADQISNIVCHKCGAGF